MQFLSTVSVVWPKYVVFIIFSFHSSEERQQPVNVDLESAEEDFSVLGGLHRFAVLKEFIGSMVL